MGVITPNIAEFDFDQFIGKNEEEIINTLVEMYFNYPNYIRIFPFISILCDIGALKCDRFDAMAKYLKERDKRKYYNQTMKLKHK